MNKVDSSLPACRRVTDNHPVKCSSVVKELRRVMQGSGRGCESKQRAREAMEAT